MLVALFDPDRVHHEAAHTWLVRTAPVAGPLALLTENALVRVLTNTSYTGTVHRPAEMTRRLEAFCRSGGHERWPDDVSVTDAGLFRLERVQGYKQLTDVYLVGLARRHGGCLATFDGSIPLGAVVGAAAEHLVIIPA